MSEMVSEMVSEQDLARARSDAAFRQQLMAGNLERLLEVLKQMRKADAPALNRPASCAKASISQSSWPTAYRQPPRAGDPAAV
jgi:hypothetical protein